MEIAGSIYNIPYTIMHHQLLEIINTVLYNNQLEIIENLEEGTRLREDLNLDSINLAELSVRLEDAYGIDVFADGMVDTIGGLIRYIEEQKNI